MTDAGNLQSHFETLGLPLTAQTWLLDLWTVIQVLDDAMDGGEAGSLNVSRAASAIFWDMPLNPFYRDNFMALQPILKLQLLKWQAANDVEGQGMADARSYMWRAGYYDVVLMVCALCGCDCGSAALQMYGETLDDYLAEWRAA